MMKIDANYKEEHVLADGTRVTLRMIRPEDGEALRRAFSRLSSRSRYRRFFAGVTELSDEMVHYLTEVDGVNHVAIVATTDSHDLKTEVGLGVARFIRLAEDAEVGEAALTVTDEAQGRGIGRLLLHAIAEAARERNIRTIRAEVLISNAPMRRLLDDLGAVVQSDDGTTLVFDMPLDWLPLDEEHADAPASDREKEHPLRRLFRALSWD
jgi:GNAT superfamily N-acetyltransferase